MIVLIEIGVIFFQYQYVLLCWYGVYDPFYLTCPRGTGRVVVVVVVILAILHVCCGRGSTFWSIFFLLNDRAP